MSWNKGWSFKERKLDKESPTSELTELKLSNKHRNFW
jgi:hypothetical protein